MVSEGLDRRITVVQFMLGPFIGRWADWDPEKKQVVFGGVWRDIPAMNARTKPTKTQVYEWILKYER